VYRYFLSWRYMRQRRTNLIGIVGVFVAVGALILILSIMTGFLDQARSTLRGSLSDLIVLPVFGPDSTCPRDPAPMLEALRADPRVASASAHLVWLCILTRNDERSAQILASSQSAQYAGVKLTGIDTGDEVETTEFKMALTNSPKVGMPVADPEHPFAPPPGHDGSRGLPHASVIVGEQLFQMHRLNRGQVIKLMTAIPNPKERSGWTTTDRDFVVAGTFRSRENEMDLERIYVERGELARMLAGVDEDEPIPAGAAQYSEVLVRLHDYTRDGLQAASDLRDTLVGKHLLERYGDVLTWEQFRKPLLGAIENERVLMAIMLSLVLLVAGFTIFAILSMMVTEKRRDIGILTALGATPRGVLSLFLLIGFWDALLGATLGAIFGIWGAVKIDPIELWLSGSFSRFLSFVLQREVKIEIFDRHVYLFDSIPSVVQPVAVAAIVLGAFVCTLLFAAIPAWKAATLDPVEALRFE
jgi:lipoprotein-releasing system permease protein